MTLQFPENKLVLASHNLGKLSELKIFLEPYDIEVLSAVDFDLDDPIEDGATFEANALIKAKYVSEKTGLAALSDDSGLCINALGGEPGIYSARWAGEPRDFQKAMSKANEALGDTEDRSAYFISVLALQLPYQDPLFFEGRCEGELVWPPRGEQGFGYDPIFVPEGFDRTFGEMAPEEKKELSHRARALTTMMAHCF